MAEHRGVASPFLAASEFLRHPLATWLVIALTIAAAVFLWFSPQAPGVAIGLLAVVSVAMTVARSTALQRLLLVGLAVAMFVLESRAIRHDRAEQDKKANDQLVKILAANTRATDAILRANGVATGAILKNASDAFETTQAAFAKSEADLKQIIASDKALGDVAAHNLSVSNANLNNLTGGASHPFLLPFRSSTEEAELSISNTGEYTLTGVSIDVVNAGDPHAKHREYEIGTIPPGQIRRTGIILPGPYVEAPRWDEYFVTTYAQNGAVVELMDIRKGTGGLPFAYRVQSHLIQAGTTAMGDLFQPKGMPNYAWSDEPHLPEPPRPDNPPTGTRSK